MDNLEKMKQEKQYEEYVTQKTPKHNVWANMLKAFLTGGIICTIGQAIYNYCERLDFSAPDPCKRDPDRYEPLSPYRKMGRSRRACSDHRIRQFRRSTCDRIQKRGAGFRNRLQDLHDRRSGHPVRDRYKQRAWSSLLDRKNNGSGLMPLPLFFLFLLLMSIYTG